MKKELRLLAVYLLLILALAAACASWWIYDGNRTPAIGTPPRPSQGPSRGLSLLEEAFRQIDWPSLTEDLDRIEDLDRSGSDAEARRLRTNLIGRHEPVFALLDESLDHPFRYPEGHRPGDDADRHPQYWDLARLYRERIEHHLESEENGAALEAFLDILDLGQRILSQGPLSGMRAGVAMQGIVTNAFGEDLPRLAGSASREASRRWESMNSMAPDFSKILESEATFTLRRVLEEFDESGWRMRFLDAYADLSRRLANDNERPLFDGLRPGDLLRLFRLHKGRIIDRYRDTRDRALAAAKRPFAEGRPHWPAAGEGPNAGLANRLAKADRAWFLFLNSQTVNRLLLTSFALELYLIDHGTYPESLDALTTDYLVRIPADPFEDGSPVHYNRTGADSFTVYSIGPDGTDDDGAPIRNDTLPSGDPRRHVPAMHSRGDISYRIVTP